MELAQQFSTIKVDFSNSDSKELSERFGIIGPPTIVFLGPDGNEIAGTRVEGYVEAEVFAGLCRKALSGNLSASQ
jgi:thiol:disulfide interchange protein DsbD